MSHIIFFWSHSNIWWSGRVPVSTQYQEFISAGSCCGYKDACSQSRSIFAQVGWTVKTLLLLLTVLYSHWFHVCCCVCYSESHKSVSKIFCFSSNVISFFFKCHLSLCKVTDQLHNISVFCLSPFYFNDSMYSSCDGLHGFVSNLMTHIVPVWFDSVPKSFLFVSTDHSTPASSLVYKQF